MQPSVTTHRNQSQSARSSEAIRGPQRQSEALRGHQRPSEALRGHQRSSEAIRGHQRSSEVIRGNQRSSEAIDAPALPPASKRAASNAGRSQSSKPLGRRPSAARCGAAPALPAPARSALLPHALITSLVMLAARLPPARPWVRALHSSEPRREGRPVPRGERGVRSPLGVSRWFSPRGVAMAVSGTLSSASMPRMLRSPGRGPSIAALRGVSPSSLRGVRPRAVSGRRASSSSAAPGLSGGRAEREPERELEDDEHRPERARPKFGILGTGLGGLGAAALAEARSLSEERTRAKLGIGGITGPGAGGGALGGGTVGGILARSRSNSAE